MLLRSTERDAHPKISVKAAKYVTIRLLVKCDNAGSDLR
jgi:hypothetical protein